MEKIWIITQREYITRVRKLSFFITTLLAPIAFFVLVTASVLITGLNQGTTKVAVIDESGTFETLFSERGLADADDGSVRFTILQERYDRLAAQLPKAKEAEEAPFQAIIHIPSDFNINRPDNPGIAYRYIERPGVQKQLFINERMTDAVQQLRMKMLDIDQTVMEQMQTKVNLNFESLTDANEKSGFTSAASLVGMLMGIAIYTSLFFYGTMIMKGVMEEKQNRIVEVLTSSVKPFQMLAGKILGIGAVGLTQILLWLILMFVVNIITGIAFGIAVGSATPPVQGAEVDPDDIQSIVASLSALPFGRIALLFPLFFLGGFLLYGSLFAAVGAAMGEDGDQQSMMIPVTIPILISFFIAMNVANNPDSSLGFWASLIPFTSPLVMSAMLPFVSSWWHILLSLVLLVAGFIFTTFIAARIYRAGILMYGKKTSFKEMIRWVFTAG